MTISHAQLEKIARLAHLDLDQSNIAALEQDIHAIMNFAEQLGAVDTTDIAPLIHPCVLHQQLRADEVTEAACLEELESIAPHFEDQLYWVPKVLESGK